PHWIVDKIRVKVSGAQRLFLGVARQSDLGTYLRGVSSATVEDFDVSPFRVTYADHAGTRVPAAPATQSFWVASSAQDLRWHLKKGRWAVVVMNADGSPGVVADVAVGAKVGPVLPTGIGLAVLGALLSALAGAERRGVTVSNTPGVLTRATAELTIALMLDLLRRISEGDRLIRRREPWRLQPTFMLGTGLEGKTLGVVGMGRIGSEVARLA